MASVRTSVEGARGCGYRKPGGLYLVADRPTETCNKLPVELHVCPTCGAGVKQSRGWTWIMPDPLLTPGPHGSPEHDAVCPLGTAVDWSGRRAGLIWVGGMYYPKPADFMTEAYNMGVSRRISAVPRGFEIGTTWVALAHAKAIRHGYQVDGEGQVYPHLSSAVIAANGDSHRVSDVHIPGVFTMFMPTAVEYIVKGTESEDELDALEARGLSLVDVRRAEEELVAT